MVVMAFRCDNGSDNRFFTAIEMVMIDDGGLV